MSKTNPFAGVVGQQEDCEQPIQIVNGQVSISVDDERDVVAAKYSCDYGYELVGEAEIVCDLDTESWQSKPPICRKSKCFVKNLISHILSFQHLQLSLRVGG